jgi:hypothetical protein
MPPVALRPRSTTELIDAAVQLLRQHYMELITTSAIFLIPAFILKLFLPDIRAGQLPTGSRLLLFTAGLAVTAVFSIVSSSAVVVIVSDSYLGREVSIGAALQRVISRIWAVFWTAILQFVLAMVGTVLFLIPGLLCVAWFFAATVVVVIEGKSTFAALARSKQLASGSVGRILGILFLTIILVFVIEVIVAMVLGFAGVLFAHAGPALTTLAGNIASLLIYPFFTVVITLLYYDLRIRKEGFDLEMMSAELGQSGPVVAASPA